MSSRVGIASGETHVECPKDPASHDLSGLRSTVQEFAASLSSFS